MTELTVTHRFAHPPEAVFDAWLDPAKAARFLFATPTGTMVRCDIDARVGGRFQIVERRGGKDADHQGAYLEIDRPWRLVFTFGDNLAFGATTVTIEIVPAPGGCDLTLTHQGVLPQWETQTLAGWTGILSALETVLD